MNRKRILAIAKLVLLFGTPIALLLGLFSCGVYWGVQHREGVTRFERDWLGLDVEVPGASAEPGEGSSASGRPAPDGEPGAATPGGDGPPSGQPKPTTVEAPTSPTSGSTVVTPTSPPPERPPPGGTPPGPGAPAGPTGIGGVPAPLPPVTTRVDALDETGRARLSVPLVVHTKVLVDPSFVDAHPDWMSQVQRTVSRASSVLEEQFGVRLELWAVGRWSVPSEGMGAADLLAELQRQPREGADILLGLTEREYDGTATDAGPVGPDDPFNGAYGVVYATAGHREPHLRTLLHEVTHLFGAQDVTDPESIAWKSGSWMSYAPVAESQAPWIDPDNRGRVLEGKGRPFAPPPSSPPAR